MKAVKSRVLKRTLGSKWENMMLIVYDRELHYF